MNEEMRQENEKMKEWADHIVDAIKRLNSTLEEHGGGCNVNYALIYDLHSNEFRGVERYGFYELANALNVKTHGELVELSDGKKHKKVWFFYRDIEFQSWILNEEEE